MLPRVVVVLMAVAVVTVIVAQEEEEPAECKKFPEGMPIDCCAFPEHDKDKLKKCFEDAKANEECADQCFFDGKKVLNDDAIDREAVLEHLKTTFAEADAGFAELHETIVDKCIEHANKKSEKHQKPNEKCSRKPWSLMMCMHRHYLRQCPAAAWTDSEKCTSWKSFWEKCPHSKFHPQGPRGKHGKGKGPKPE